MNGQASPRLVAQEIVAEIRRGRSEPLDVSAASRRGRSPPPKRPASFWLHRLVYRDL